MTPTTSTKPHSSTQPHSATQVVVISKSESQIIQSSSLTVVGGINSTGKRISSLKEKGDYVALSPDANGVWSVHILTGKKRGLHKLIEFQPLAIDDLTVIALPISFAGTPASDLGQLGGDSSDWFLQILELVRNFNEPTDLKPALAKVLELFALKFGFEKGLVVLATGNGQFESVISAGLKVNDPWLSESLIQDTLKSQTPIMIPNVTGSRYDQTKSLVATGFNTVASWPLVLRGKTLGTLTVGSTKPHSGLSARDEMEALLLVSLTSLLVQFQQRDEALKKEIALSRQKQSIDDGPFVTQSPAMREALALARDVAASDLSVLIQGETGVGKEVLARWIHDLSARCKGPFIAINCAAIPRDLLESVLFGHKRGAFTGAATDQAGKFLAANGGTLFLDEIGELPQSLQAKILRAVQEKTIEPLGSNRSMRVDVRFISATHRDLPTLIRSGSFREDLFYRLAEVALTLPALRTRMADVPLLATSFLREFAPEKSFTQAAWIWLKTRDWPGNVRELRSTLKRVSLLTRTNEVDVSDLVRGLPDQDLQRDLTAGPANSSWLDGETLDDARNRFTARKVREALLRSGGHRAKAAELLAITPRTLFRYLEEHQALIGDVTDLSSRNDRGVTNKAGPDA